MRALTYSFEGWVPTAREMTIFLDAAHYWFEETSRAVVLLPAVPGSFGNIRVYREGGGLERDDWAGSNDHDQIILHPRFFKPANPWYWFRFATRQTNIVTHELGHILRRDHWHSSSKLSVMHKDCTWAPYILGVEPSVGDLIAAVQNGTPL